MVETGWDGTNGIAGIPNIGSWCGHCGDDVKNGVRDLEPDVRAEELGSKDK